MLDSTSPLLLLLSVLHFLINLQKLKKLFGGQSKIKGRTNEERLENKRTFNENEETRKKKLEEERRKKKEERRKKAERRKRKERRKKKEERRKRKERRQKEDRRESARKIITRFPTFSKRKTKSAIRENLLETSNMYTPLLSYVHPHF